MRKRKSILISSEIHEIARKIRKEHGISIQHKTLFFYDRKKVVFLLGSQTNGYE